MFIGIGLFRFWYQYNLYNLHFTTDYGIGVAWTNVLRALIIFVLLFAARKVELPPRVRNALVWSSLVLMTLSSVLNLLELVTGNTSFETVRYVTCGAGLVWGGGMWMDFFSRLEPRRAFFYLISGLAFSCLLSLLGGFISPYGMALVGLFIPSFAVLAYWHASHLLDKRGYPPAVDPANPARNDVPFNRKFRNLGIALYLFAFIMGIALGFPDGQPRELSQTMRSIHQVSLIVVLALFGHHVLMGGRAFRFRSVWYFENVLMMASIIMLVSAGELENSLGTAGVLSAESFFYTFTFFTSYEIGRRSKRTTMCVLGWLYGGTLFCMGTGRLLSSFLASLPDAATLMVVVMSVCAVIEMVLAVRLDIASDGAPLYSDLAFDHAVNRADAVATAPSPGADGTPIAPPRADAERQQDLQARYSLSDAETSIAAYIASGRSRSFIARELGYSENTIRNYTHSLYKKLGVHNKQQLIDIVSAEDAE